MAIDIKPKLQETYLIVYDVFPIQLTKLKKLTLTLFLCTFLRI